MDIGSHFKLVDSASENPSGSHVTFTNLHMEEEHGVGYFNEPIVVGESHSSLADEEMWKLCYATTDKVGFQWEGDLQHWLMPATSLPAFVFYAQFGFDEDVVIAIDEEVGKKYVEMVKGHVWDGETMDEIDSGEFVPPYENDTSDDDVQESEI